MNLISSSAGTMFAEAEGSQQADDGEVPADEVPPALLHMVERLNVLLRVSEVFRGWDQDVAHSKALSIKVLRNIRHALHEVRILSNYISGELDKSRGTQCFQHYLVQKIQYMQGNIPDRFNCPSNLGSKPAIIEEVKSVPSVPTASAPKLHSNIPEVLFLTTEEFEKVPKYLRGRATYDKINGFIELYNKVLSQKYAIFKKKRSVLKKREADLWNEFHKQELKETKGLYFCVANDFQTFNGRILDKASLNFMTILRHCGRIRELRVGGIHRYVAVF